VADLTLSLSDGVGAALTAPSSVETPGVLIEVQGNAESRAARKQITLLEGDTLPDLVFLLLDGDGGVYDLAGATVTFRLRQREADAGTYIVEGACTVLQSGAARYRLQDGDTDTAGEYYAEVVMVFADGLQYTSEMFVVRILERV